jgi:hypothetical protein
VEAGCVVSLAVEGAMIGGNYIKRRLGATKNGISVDWSTLVNFVSKINPTWPVIRGRVACASESVLDPPSPLGSSGIITLAGYEYTRRTCVFCINLAESMAWSMFPSESEVRAMGPEKSTTTLEKIEPKTPAGVLVLGSIAWRLLSWVSNIDFILSMREEKIAMLFQILLSWGWIVIIALGILWAIVSRDTRRTYGGMSLSVGVLAFMFGALIATYATQSVPQLLTAWGSDSNPIIDSQLPVALRTLRLIRWMTGG